MRTIKLLLRFVMNKSNCRNDIIYLIRHLAKLLDADFDQRVRSVGLTGGQARILFYINRKTNVEKLEVHQNDIEKEFCLAKSTVNGLVSRLLKTKYIIKRNVHPYSVLEITEEGTKALKTIREGRDLAVNKLFIDFTEEEREKSIKQINRLIDNMEGGK